MSSESIYSPAVWTGMMILSAYQPFLIVHMWKRKHLEPISQHRPVLVLIASSNVCACSLWFCLSRALYESLSPILTFLMLVSLASWASDSINLMAISLFVRYVRVYYCSMFVHVHSKKDHALTAVARSRLQATKVSLNSRSTAGFMFASWAVMMTLVLIWLAVNLVKTGRALEETIDTLMIVFLVIKGITSCSMIGTTLFQVRVSDAFGIKRLLGRVTV